MENLSLFEQWEEGGRNTSYSHGKKLDVVRLEFLEAETMSWQELFSGFDTLHAITYSSGIGFICSLLKQFSSAEIIFGCEETISYTLQEIIAYSTRPLSAYGDSERYEAGPAFPCRGGLRASLCCQGYSHEKIYLLSAEDGGKRVVMGSANMSFSAFGGGQRENICYIDGGRAYDWYMECFRTLQESSTDQIVKESLLTADDGKS